jgi:Asp-tRNA(Asn)/Glu-tRNA(Gln) amidotransferase A subunit family amidase
MQIMAPPFKENLLFNVASAFEQEIALKKEKHAIDF